LFDAGERQHNTIRQVPVKMAVRYSGFSYSLCRILPTLISRGKVILNKESVASDSSPANIRETAATSPDQQRRTLRHKDTINDFKVYDTTNRYVVGCSLYSIDKQEQA
jgi:hypothetical protein